MYSPPARRRSSWCRPGRATRSRPRPCFKPSPWRSSAPTSGSASPLLKPSRPTASLPSPPSNWFPAAASASLPTVRSWPRVYRGRAGAARAPTPRGARPPRGAGRGREVGERRARWAQWRPPVQRTGWASAAAPIRRPMITAPLHDGRRVLGQPQVACTSAKRLPLAPMPRSPELSVRTSLCVEKWSNAAFALLATYDAEP
jgi:hypothetical protein